jgi:aldehyde:ferredoxin oxidoreductase
VSGRGTPRGGYAGRVLRVDLTSRTTSEYPWGDEERRAFLGGKSMAAKILWDLLPAGTDPLGPDNVLVVSTGPLTGSGAPSTSRFNVSALSPLTGTVASSNCGGGFGTHLKKAGYDALVIVGAAEEPVWLELTEDGVIFHDGTGMWGERTGETQAILREIAGPGSSAMVIGPAGENLVRYAAIMSDERAAGRTGLGAVMGAKKTAASR